MFRGTLAVSVALATVLLGCNSASESDGAIGLRVVSGADGIDSANARLSAPLMIELRDGGGHPIANQSVTFQGTGCPASCSALLLSSGNPSDSGQQSLVEVTDAAGKATVLVRLGQRSGPATVSIEAPDYTPILAHYTVTPGRLASLSASPSDTGVVPTTRFRLRIAPTDINGNPAAIGTAPLFTALDPGVATITSSGGVAALATGLARFEVSVGPWRDTVALAVVPSLTIGVNDLGGSILSMGLDGSSRKSWSLSDSGAGLEALAWVPGQGRLVFSKVFGTQNVGRALLADLIHDATRITLTDTLETLECYPQVSQDGTEVYFSAIDLISGSGYGIYRVGLDGTGLIRTAAPAGSFEPDIAIDMDRIVYSVVNVVDTTCGIGVLTQSTGTNVCLHQSGILPRWSPDGTRIAFIAVTDYSGVGPLTVMNADGSGVTTISLPGHRYIDAGVSWSPDNQWVLAVNFGFGMELVRVSDGLTIPLTWLPRAGWSAIQS